MAKLRAPSRLCVKWSGPCALPGVGGLGVFVYIGTYANEGVARDDYEVVKALHSAGAVGTYDAAVITKDEDGKVHVNKDETATRHGAWGGMAVGAVVGLLFPPSIVKEFGELIDSGEACLLIVGESTVEAALEKAELKADNEIQKQLDVDAKDVDKSIQESARELS